MVLAELVDPAVAGATRAADPITVRSSTGDDITSIQYGKLIHQPNTENYNMPELSTFSYKCAVKYMNFL